jgi:hypothetical protein
VTAPPQKIEATPHPEALAGVEKQFQSQYTGAANEFARRYPVDALLQSAGPLLKAVPAPTRKQENSGTDPLFLALRGTGLFK